MVYSGRNDPMRTPIPLLALALCSRVAFPNVSAQGLVNFFNNASSLVSAGVSPNTATPIYSTSPFYYFALLTATTGPDLRDNFNFSGVLATNQVTAGLFNGGVGIAVPGWPAGTARDFIVVGWGGTTPIFNPSWVDIHGNIVISGLTPPLFGISSMGKGVAGGVTDSGTFPALNIFGGATGIQNGFGLYSYSVPEPYGVGLMVFGTAVMFALHRRAVPNTGHAH